MIDWFIDGLIDWLIGGFNYWLMDELVDLPSERTGRYPHMRHREQSTPHRCLAPRHTVVGLLLLQLLEDRRLVAVGVVAVGVVAVGVVAVGVVAVGVVAVRAVGLELFVVLVVHYAVGGVEGLDVSVVGD